MLVLKIEGVDKESSDSFIGYHFEFKNGYLEVTISNFVSCCEIYGVNIELKDQVISYEQEFDYSELSELFTENVSIAYFSPEASEIKSCFAEDFKRVGVKVTDSVDSFKVTAWNEHNGYYPHTVWVSWKCDDKEVKDKEYI